jgi:hypothetical protein
MNSRIVLFSLIATFLLLALVVPALAQTRTVGVSVGNTFTYGVTVRWSSNDSTATLPSNLVDINNTQWAKFTITAISGTNITGQTTAHYKNGTETTMGVWKDVNTGSGNMSVFVISANLTSGDSWYNSSSITSVTINETVPRTYSGVDRDINHLNLTSSSGGQNESLNFYWDKSTGVLVEELQQITNQTGAYTTTSSVDIQITSSDVWTVPEFPTWTSALLILVTLTSATIIIARQKQPKRPFG